MDIPIQYVPTSLDEDVNTYPRFEVNSITPSQLKFLILTGCICDNGEIGMPLFIQSLDISKFEIKDELPSYINLLSIFKGRNIYVRTSDDDIREFTKKDLYKFIFQ